MLASWRAYSSAGTVRFHNYTIDDVSPLPTNTQSLSACSPLPTMCGSCYHHGCRMLIPASGSMPTLLCREMLSKFLKSRNSSFPIAAFPRKNTQLGRKMIQKLKTRWKLDVASQLTSFNGGIIVLNLKMWRERDYVKDILYLCKLNDENNLWPVFGSQPPLQLLFADDRFEHLDAKLLID